MYCNILQQIFIINLNQSLFTNKHFTVGFCNICQSIFISNFLNGFKANPFIPIIFTHMNKRFLI